MNPKVVTIELTKYEMEMACQVAMRRQVDAEYAGMRDRVNYKTFSEGLRVHMLGCMGEVGVAKWMGIYWNGSSGTFSMLSDLGGGIEVRHRSLDIWDLIIRGQDRDDSTYVLSTGDGRRITIHGAISGKEGKRNEWLRTHGNKSAAFFVPSESLTITPDELRKMAIAGRG